MSTILLAFYNTLYNFLFSETKNPMLQCETAETVETIETDTHWKGPKLVSIPMLQTLDISKTCMP